MLSQLLGKMGEYGVGDDVVEKLVLERKRAFRVDDRERSRHPQHSTNRDDIGANVVAMDTLRGNVLPKHASMMPTATTEIKECRTGMQLSTKRLAPGLCPRPEPECLLKSMFVGRSNTPALYSSMREPRHFDGVDHGFGHAP